MVFMFNFGQVTSVVLGVFTYTILKEIYGLVYNVYLSPLNKFPGPKFAAITEWYKTYQEVFLRKSWQQLLVDLHKQYGMRLPRFTGGSAVG